MLTLLTQSFQTGGPVTFALTALGLLLGFLLVERFWDTERRIHALTAARTAIHTHTLPHLPSNPAPNQPHGLRRLALIRAGIVIAPLLGLLGTVNGIIYTFESIVAGGYLAEMSTGIAQALHTTQHGLAIAAPSLLAERILIRRLDTLACLTPLHTQSHPERIP